MINVVSSTNGSLKKISGDLLLMLYALQRRQGYCDDGVLVFDRKMMGSAFDMEKSPLGARLIQYTSFMPDIFNALRYLQEKGFVRFSEVDTNMTFNFSNIRVTAGGVDIIEGVERGADEREKFYLTFNIKLAETINVDSLIKAEIGSIFKAAII